MQRFLCAPQPNLGLQYMQLRPFTYRQMHSAHYHYNKMSKKNLENTPMFFRVLTKIKNSTDSYLITVIALLVLHSEINSGILL
jgi:hypothetical protein